MVDLCLMVIIFLQLEMLIFKDNSNMEQHKMLCSHDVKLLRFMPKCWKERGKCFATFTVTSLISFLLLHKHSVFVVFVDRHSVVIRTEFQLRNGSQVLGDRTITVNALLC